MHVAEFFENVVLLQGAGTSANPVRERLEEMGHSPLSMDLADGVSWRKTLAQSLSNAKQCGAPGVLLMLGDQCDDEAFWRSQDALVESLASRAWDIVYLGHGASQENDPAADRPSLVHCDMPPSNVSAIVISCAALQFLVDAMPDHGVDGPLSPADWLAIACWLAIASVRPQGSLAAWPPLMHTGTIAPIDSTAAPDRAEVDFTRRVHCLLGLPFDAVTLPEAAEHLEAVRAQGKRCFLSTPNLNFAVTSLNDAAFRDSVCRSDLSVADGMPLIWAARLLGVPLKERVSGSSLFDYLRKRSQARWNVFFFGGNDGAGDKACKVLAHDQSAMHPAGHLNPGFGNVEQMSRPDWIQEINSRQPDMIVVSLGSAKGQSWIDRNLNLLNASVITNLGAVINFVAGSVNRAPLWMQRAGLEWLWRIKEEPYLWRRYLNDGLALARLLATRMLPLAVWQRLGTTPKAEFWRAYVSSSVGASTVRVKMGGAWRDSNLKSIRTEFARLYKLGRSVTVDLSDSTWVDSAFLGILLILEAALRDRGAKLSLINVNDRLGRLLQLHGVQHLVRT